jgi:hypothetical protein
MLQRDQQAQSNVLKFNVVKNRHDTMGLIYMDFDLETGRIRERITESD